MPLYFTFKNSFQKFKFKFFQYLYTDWKLQIIIHIWGVHRTQLILFQIYTQFKMNFKFLAIFLLVVIAYVAAGNTVSFFLVFHIDFLSYLTKFSYFSDEERFPKCKVSKLHSAREVQDSIKKCDKFCRKAFNIPGNCVREYCMCFHP